MGVSDFEKQRLENIQRNKELLRLLNLDTLSNSIKRELPSAAPKPAPKKKQKQAPSQPKPPQEPSRRSRRLAGVKVENAEEYAKLQQEAEEIERKKKEAETLKQTRLFGDISLVDLVTDPKGELKNGTVKTENGSNNTELGENSVLGVLRGLGEKFLAGDFYDLIRKQDNDYNLNAKREEFDKLALYEKTDPLDIKITHQRISSIVFHPSTTDRVIAVGDTVGNVGVWAVDHTSTTGKSSRSSRKPKTDPDDDAEPAISIMKPHGKLVSRILVPSLSPTKIYSASYDGSVRSLDLNKLNSTELAYMSDPYTDTDYALGVSDVNFAADNDNVLYMTTLSGNFYQHDIRTPFKKTNAKHLLRLHDKKIGSFSVNPNAAHQIATASLDRTLKIWDLRNVAASTWSDYEEQVSPHCYGSYASRLSVSCVDWNPENRLVCNGYDDQIAVFDLSGSKNVPPVVKWAKDYQPNVEPKPVAKRRRSAKKDDHEQEQDDMPVIPVNIEPFTKIKHNCQTGRWVSILKSKWQTNPADGVQKFCIANMNRGIDVYDQKGQILAHLTEEKVGAVPAVVTMHPLQNWAVGGSASGKLYFFE